MTETPAAGEGADQSTSQTEQCQDCGEPPKGVTMGPAIDGWSCPYCGTYNQINDDKQ